MLMIVGAAALFYLGWLIGDSVGRDVGYREGFKDMERGEPFNPKRLDRFKF